MREPGWQAFIAISVLVVTVAAMRYPGQRRVQVLLAERLPEGGELRNQLWKRRARRGLEVPAAVQHVVQRGRAAPGGGPEAPSRHNLREDGILGVKGRKGRGAVAKDLPARDTKRPHVRLLLQPPQRHGALERLGRQPARAHVRGRQLARVPRHHGGAVQPVVRQLHARRRQALHQHVVRAQVALEAQSALRHVGRGLRNLLQYRELRGER
mmetsp:Transcript_2308/g.5800  ORF Transcript_2308/g.5800 Transcript_2308/m.5800 type:complete len:211 (+) Transcript_2308:325-957(+)